VFFLSQVNAKILNITVYGLKAGKVIGCRNFSCYAGWKSLRILIAINKLNGLNAFFTYVNINCGRCRTIKCSSNQWSNVLSGCQDVSDRAPQLKQQPPFTVFTRHDYICLAWMSARTLTRIWVWRSQANICLYMHNYNFLLFCYAVDD